MARKFISSRTKKTILEDSGQDKNKRIISFRYEKRKFTKNMIIMRITIIKVTKLECYINN